MFIEDKNKLERNKYLNMSDEEILKCIDEAILNYNVDGYTQHCEPVECIHCHKDAWHELDVFDYIADAIRLNKIKETMSEKEYLEYIKTYSRVNSKLFI